MIPATSIAFQDDGTAWWTFQGDVQQIDGIDDVIWDQDRPCDTCFGRGFKSMLVKNPKQNAWNGIHVRTVPCPADCINGRHTFTINVETYDLECAQCGASASLPLGMTCGDHRPMMSVRSLRVSVVPGIVLPIVDMTKVNSYPCITVNTECDEPDALIEWTADTEGDITLPSDAKPGGWAVQLVTAEQ